MPSRLQRFLIVMLVALLPLSPVILVPGGSVAQEVVTATTTDSLNMRTGPGLGNPVILVIPYGESVTVRGGEQNGFLPIRYAGRDGWSSKDYLALASRTSSVEVAGVTTDALNLRSGPSSTSPVIVVIPSGADLVVTGESSNGYLAVTWSSFKGYAHGDWIRQGGTPQPEQPTVPQLPVRGSAVTTAALNMRAGAGTSYSVLTVMPLGVTVSLTGQSANGFYGVTWNGKTGWGAAEYLRVSSGEPPAPTTPAPTPPPATSGKTAVTTDDLNMRTGAGLGNPVVLVIPSGATVTLTGQSANGYLQVTYNGRTGWSAQDWLRVSSGSVPVNTPTPSPTPAPPVTSTKGTGITTDALNMRSGAATTFPVIQVIPASATVQLTGKSSGTFLEVTYSGKTGWSHRDWIKPQETETRPTRSATVTEALNMRSGPATSYSVITVMPAGATVVLTGQEANGFQSVSYNGKTGWGFGTYLSITPATAPQPTLPPTPVPTKVPPTPVPTAVPPTPKPTATAPIPTPNPVTVLPKPWPEIETNHGYHWTNTIQGPVRGTPTQAIDFARRAGALRMDEVEKYVNEVYRLAPQLGFDPSLIVAQSALETGYWKSYWWKERLNPAGLQINDDPSTHGGSPGFEDGTIAARAQMAHMHAEVYGDREPLPAELQGVDIGYEAVFKAGWAGDIVTLEDLGGTWATDTSYGFKIARVAAQIFG